MSVFGSNGEHYNRNGGTAAINDVYEDAQSSVNVDNKPLLELYVKVCIFYQNFTKLCF